MTKTTNYQLPKWEKTDRIQMKDFNDMTATLDAALKASADAIAAAAAAQSNCNVVCGSYTGTGGCGADNKNTLTFAEKPMLVIVFSKSLDDKMHGLILARGAGQTYVDISSNSKTVDVSWTELSVSWYATGGAEVQGNRSGREYTYIAFLAK